MQWQEIHTKSNTGKPGFAIFGLGGSANSPKVMCIIPVTDFPQPKIPVDEIWEYKRNNPDQGFHYDTKEQILK